MIRVDLVAAVRDEEHNIPVFLEQISGLALGPEIRLRVIFIEDSSTDRTRAVLRRISAEDRSVAYCSLSQCFGQGPAIVFGLHLSDADAVIMMDADGSHPVDAVPEMIQRFVSGAEVVQCVRRTLANRKAYRRAGAATFRYIARIITGVDINEQNIFFRLVSAKIARNLLEQPRYWHWLRFPLPSEGEGGLAKIEIASEERTLGESKYGFLRLINLGINGMLSLVSVPRLVVLLGMGGLFAILLIGVGAWPIGLLTLTVMVWIVTRYSRLRDADMLLRMNIDECANLPGEVSA